MDFAVVKISGKQHLIQVGDVIDIAADLGKVGDKLDFKEVLLLSLSDKLQIGEPVVSGAEILGEVIFAGRGEKLRISKFKAKSRYRKTIGFRADLTKIKITSLDGKVEAKTEAKPAKTAKIAKPKVAKKV